LNILNQERSYDALQINRKKWAAGFRAYELGFPHDFLAQDSVRQILFGGTHMQML
jgi:hypothetical protein